MIRLFECSCQAQSFDAVSQIGDFSLETRRDVQLSDPLKSDVNLFQYWLLIEQIWDNDELEGSAIGNFVGVSRENAD